MKKLSKLVICLILVLIVGLAGILTACDEDETPVVVDNTPRYSVTFYGNYPGDATPEASQLYATTVKQGSVVTKSSVPEAVRPAGYTFVNWFTEATGGEIYDFGAVTKSTAVYAQWASNGKSSDVSLTENAAFDIPTETVYYPEVKLDSEGKPELVEGKQVIERKSKQVETGVYMYNGLIRKSFNFDASGFSTFINPKATYAIYYDEECEDRAENIVTLTSGNNFFFMKVTAEDTIATKVYRINLYSEPTFSAIVRTNRSYSSATYYDNLDGGTLLPTPKIKNDDGSWIYEGQVPVLTEDGDVKWMYHSDQLRDANGNIVDVDGVVLKKFENVYYCVNNDGTRVPVNYLREGSAYKLFVEGATGDGKESTASGTLYFVTINDVNYITDVNGDYNYASGAMRQIITFENSVDWYSVVDSDGHPIYKLGKAVEAPYENVWHFGIPVYEDVSIYLDWVEEEYTLTLDKAQAEAVYDGTTTNIKVKYGYEKDALAAIVWAQNYTDPYFPNDNATFLGWFYHDATTGEEILMVGPRGKGVLGWFIPGDATLHAHWQFKTYNVDFVTDDAATGTVSGSGECESNSSIVGTAVPAEGYVLSEWYVVTSTGQHRTLQTGGNSFTYNFNGDDYDTRTGKVTIRAAFTKIKVRVTLDYNPSVAKPTGAPDYVDATYGNPVYSKTATEGVLPVINITTGASLFDGWYYRIPYVETDHSGLDAKYLIDTDEDGTPDFVKVFIANKNNEALAGYTTWKFTADTTLYVQWNPNQYTVEALNASYNSTVMGNIEFTTGFTDGGVTDVTYDSLTSYTLSGKKAVKVYGTTFRISRIPLDESSPYRFMGWYYIDVNSDDPFGEGLQKITAEDGVTLDADETYIEFTLGNEDVTIVAMWYYKPVKYYLDKGTSSETVTFPTSVLTEEGTGKRYIELEIDKEYDKLPVLSGLENYTFKGWYFNNLKLIDANGKLETVLTNPQLIFETLTLVARWEQIEYFTKNEDGYINGLSDVGKNEAVKGTVLEIKADVSIVGIAEGAFEGVKELKKIVIRSNITSIGKNAFKNSGVISVSFIGNFRELNIAAGAFDGCISLTTITFPAVATIEAGALKGCSGLTTIEYSGNVVLGSLFTEESPLSSSWYSAEQDGVTYWLPISLITVNFNSADGKLANHALGHCEYVNKVGLGTVTDIGEYAFQFISTRSTALDIDLSGVANIGFAAFKGAKISTVSLDNIDTISAYAFSESKLTAVTIGANNFRAIPAYCFYKCELLENVTMDAIYTVNSSAFYGCTALTSIGGENRTTAISSVGTYAFYNSGLTATAVQNNLSGVKAAGRNAFHGTAWYNGITNGVMIVGTILYYNKNATTFDFTGNTTITAIADGAFENTTLAQTALDLSGMTSLTTIGGEAFINSDLVSIVMPASLVAINPGAFENCASLATVNMSACANLATIGTSAFSRDTALANVTFYEFPTADAFNNSTTRLRINGKTFMNCANLVSINLPDNLAYLGSYVFAECTRLSTVTFVDGTNFETTAAVGGGEGAEPTPSVYNSNIVQTLFTSIGACAFTNTSLGTITIPYFVSSIGESAFTGCDNLTQIITESNSAVEHKKTTNLVVIGAHAFAGDANLQEFTVKTTSENNTTPFHSLGVGAFEGCVSLTVANLGTRITVIPDRAFDGCSALTSVTYSASNTTIGAYAFRNCLALGSVPKFSSVGDYAFAGCSLIKSFSMEGSGRTIGNYAFAGCTGISSFTIPAAVTAIGEGAFEQCVLLSAINLDGASLENIGQGAFTGCVMLSELTIGAKVANIGASAFAGCYGLDAVTIGESVTYIGARAFDHCDGIVITMNGIEVPKLGGSIFTEGMSDYTIRVPASYTIYYTDENSDWAEYDGHFVEY